MRRSETRANKSLILGKAAKGVRRMHLSRTLFITPIGIQLSGPHQSRQFHSLPYEVTWSLHSSLARRILPEGIFFPSDCTDHTKRGTQEKGNSGSSTKG